MVLAPPLNLSRVLFFLCQKCHLDLGLSIAFGENKVSVKLLPKAEEPLLLFAVVFWFSVGVGRQLLSCFGGCSQVTENQAQLSLFGNITSILSTLHQQTYCKSVLISFWVVVSQNSFSYCWNGGKFEGYCMHVMVFHLNQNKGCQFLKQPELFLTLSSFC